MDTPRFNIQCLEGPGRGKVWRDLPLPVRIGRGMDCEVQFDEPKLLPLRWQVEVNPEGAESWLLVSFNGDDHVDTYLRGNLRDGTVVWPVIKPGDLLHVGKTVLLVGSREQIARRVARLGTRAETASATPPGNAESDADRELAAQPIARAAMVETLVTCAAFIG